MSRGLGWPNVPLTVVRDGPHGVGSVQLYVNSDPGTTYFDLIDSRREDLKRFAVFDLLANNADRKAGHCLLGRDGPALEHRPRADLSPGVQAEDGDGGVLGRDD